MREKKSPGFQLYIIAILIFLFLPILIIILFSFVDSSSLVFPIEGFSLRWYFEVFSDKEFLISIKNSAVVAVIVSILSGIIGTVTSFALNKYKFEFKNVLSTFYMIPFTLPGLILGISLLMFFDTLNFKLSLVTVTLGHLVFCIPFVFLVMNARLERLDFTIEEVAIDLGANPFQVFMKVTFPLIKSSLFGAMLIAFALSFDEFVVTFFTVGAKNTLPLIIWGMMRMGVSPVINAISSLVTVITIILIVISLKIFKVNINI